MTRYYTGVGHRLRNVEPGVEEFVLWLSAEMADRDIHLLSGDADGIDEFFERNCDNKCTIYLPNKKFGHYEGRDTSTRYLLDDEEKAYADLQLSFNRILPEIKNMSEHNKKYHRRNFYQAWNFGELPEVCFYYAKEDENGRIDGGTRTAVYTARYFSVPCYNLYTVEGRDEVRELLLAGEWG